MRRSISTRKTQHLYGSGDLFNEKDVRQSGWLKKQGGKFKTLKRRYFILANNVLYYFTNQSRTVLKGQINLKNLEISELEEDKPNNEYNFFILPEIGKEFINESHIKYLLSTNEREDALKWLFHLKQAVYLERGGGLFGTPLSLVMPYLKEEYCYVPKIVYECCQYIRQNGMNEEGIFRKNGQLSLVNQMKEKVDRAIYDWTDCDIHTVCSLLKLYLRELPEPLIPFSEYDSLKAVGYRIDVKEDLGLVKEKLFKLPLPNLQLLKYLCQFLIEVSNHSENRMEISSLAKIFSPNILHDQDTDPYVEESTNCVITVTVAAFIKSHEDLFQFEYEPLWKYDGDVSHKDAETYSLKSAFSIANFCSSPESERGRSTEMLSNRVQSMILYDSSDFSEGTLSQDTIINTIPRQKLELTDYSDKTPVFHKKLSLPNGGIINENNSLNSCEHCVYLERQLRSVTEERNSLQRKLDAKSIRCKSLEHEVETLKNEVTRMQTLAKQNPYDLSDVLEYFKK